MKNNISASPIEHDGEKYEPFCHCPTVCPHQDGVLLAYYAGLHEAHDSQHVRVIYHNGAGTYVGEIKLRYKTGNPVIWSIGDSAVLLFSKFEKDTEKSVQKWMYCSNWLATISFSNGVIKHSSPKALDIEIGHLGRCAPINVNNEWLLPLYREHDPYGLILASSDGIKWEKRGIIGECEEETATRFGKGILIQPTLWSDGHRLYSLSRDISRQGFAWYSESNDWGATWSKPDQSQIPNANNSIVAIHDGTKNPRIIWNGDRDRKMLMIGKFENGKIHHIEQLNDGKKAAYPNYCFDKSGRLHIVHADNDYTTITHHILPQ